MQCKCCTPGHLPSPCVLPCEVSYRRVDITAERGLQPGSGGPFHICRYTQEVLVPRVGLALWGSPGSPGPLFCAQEEDEFIVEGLLNISWGLRRPIRLQMQDDNERIRPPPSSSSWHSGCNLGAQG